MDDITSDSSNRIILRRLQRNEADDANSLYIENEHGEYVDGEEECVDYVPEGAADMGWLGYFVGRNKHLQKLVINSFLTRDVIAPFLRGVNRNTSIKGIEFANINLLGGQVFTMLGSFFKSNHNLTSIIIHNCGFGDEGVRLLFVCIGDWE